MLHIVLDNSGPAAVIAAAAKMLQDESVTTEKGSKLKASFRENSADSPAMIVKLLSTKPSFLAGKTPLERSEIDQYVFLSDKLDKSSNGGLVKSLEKLDKDLKKNSFLVSSRLTWADIAVYGRLTDIKSSFESYGNVQRYFGLMEAYLKDIESGAHTPWLDAAADNVAQVGKKANKGNDKKGDARKEGSPTKSGKENRAPRPTGGEKQKDQGKFVELPGAKMGEVVVRFPPEASGFLHIGHAKAALLNQHYQQMFQGKLIMRFDDTNPAKEKADFEEVILGDLEMLQIKPDRFTYTSDYFDLMLGMCEDLIKKGNAFVDDTDPETMKQERADRVESKNRNNSVEKNLRLWDEMKKGSPAGQKCCVRAKIDMNSVNGCMRDPTIYRCKDEPHPRHGNKYKVYPTYDFACPIVDSIEGVTHALRTTEYHDRDDQFFWFIDVLKLRKPYIYEYSRLNLTNTVLSKRKLTWFVDQGLVDGWDDPRFPTVRGILRRGMTVEGLKQFIVAQGSSRSVVMMEWDKIWAFNRKVIDPIAPRHTALLQEGRIIVDVKDAEETVKQFPAHPKNPDVGNRNVWTSKKIYVEEADAVLFKEGENVTFINWGNLKITSVKKDKSGKITSIEAETNLSNTDFKNTLKVTWLAATSKTELTPIKAVHFDHIISKAVLGKDEDFKQYIGKNTRVVQDLVGDEDLKNVKKGDIIQLQRKGFFICDEPLGPRSGTSFFKSPIVLHAIPDGHTKSVATANAPKTQQEQAKSPAKEVPKEAAATTTGTGSAGEQLYADIEKQGNKVRDLKVAKAAKDAIQAEVKKLLDLKAKFKEVTGSDYAPGKPPAPAAATAPAQSQGGADYLAIYNQLEQQGTKVRDLKAAKAAKDVVQAEVKVLLDLKAKYKEVTGSDYFAGKPPAGSAPAAAALAPTQSRDHLALFNQLEAQGKKVRDLKSAKAAKDVVQAEVKVLLDLKTKYKEATGSDYVAGKPPAGSAPAVAAPSSPSGGSQEDQLYAEVEAQGNKVRDVKAAKAGKSVVEGEVKKLLEFKAKYKEVTGKDYAPGQAKKVEQTSTPVKQQEQAPKAASVGSNKAFDLYNQLEAQGKKVRDLKAAKASKDTVQAGVKTLLELKGKYKEVTGEDYVSGKPPATMTADQPAAGGDGADLKVQIEAQGNKVRELKGAKAAKDAVDAEVKKLLELKAKFKEATGQDYVAPGGGGARPKSDAPKKEAKKEVKKQAPTPKQDTSAGAKKQTRLGLEAKKAENLSDWYSQVITKSEMIEYYDVSGCYIFRPWSYAIWEIIMRWFDTEIKKLGVQNAYFPMFVSQSALEREKNHIADFAPEVAWVTKSGDSDLAEPVAIRPTSETVMYPSYAKWIQSYRDLPLKLNQWNSVVRWEFKHPQPFLRTREFLWQEGHSAFATYEEAEEEVYKILDLYEKIYTYLMAIPVIPGKKTEKEKFPGGDYTTTVEAFVPASGRGLQGATSHHLGQNFSKMFEIVFEDPETQEKRFAYQNSWGLSTRTIGAMVMIHGDDQGLVLPPRIASVQVVVIPCGITVNLAEADKKALIAKCETYLDRLTKSGVRVKLDDRDNYSPGWKFNHWELKGVPIRIEVGPKDMQSSQYVAVRRDNGAKGTYQEASLEADVEKLLNDIHDSMYNKVKQEMDSHTCVTEDWKTFCAELDKKKIIMSPFCGGVECEEHIKKDSARDEPSEPGAPAMGAKSLCVPFKQPKDLAAGAKCIHPDCTAKPQKYTLFGRSY